MNGDMEAWQAREIKDRSPAFSKVLGIGCRYTDDTGRQSSPGKLQTALPSNAGLKSSPVQSLFVSEDGIRGDSCY